jgi:hypothetical protein
MLDQGQTLKSLIQQLVSFFDDDIYAALLVLGGTAMSFHYDLLHSLIGGVPITMAIGDPVSGKSTAVEAALALFDERESVGGWWIKPNLFRNISLKIILFCKLCLYITTVFI